MLGRGCAVHQFPRIMVDLQPPIPESCRPTRSAPSNFSPSYFPSVTVRIAEREPLWENGRGASHEVWWVFTQSCASSGTPPPACVPSRRQVADAQEHQMVRVGVYPALSCSPWVPRPFPMVLRGRASLQVLPSKDTCLGSTSPGQLFSHVPVCPGAPFHHTS